MPGMSDAGVLERLRAGDARAWDGLVDRYSRLVWSIPLTIGLSPDDAADIAQMAFTELLIQLHSIRDETAIGAWLATVARRQSWRRARSRWRETPDDVATRGNDAGTTDAGTVSDADRVDTLIWIDAGLATLGERCRALVQLLYLSGTEPSYEEVSARLGMPIGSIGPTRQRCLRQLEAALAAFDDAGTTPAGTGTDQSLSS
jgi:RNA polymerase sigma factor (sigma-70 family)